MFARLWLMVMIVGCKHYDRDRLEAVCEGNAYDAAAAYEPNASPTGKYPMAMVEKWARTKWTLNTTKPFQAATDAPSAENYKDVSLAFCVEQQPGPFDRDCDMDSFNGTMDLDGAEPKVDVKKAPGGAKVIKAYGSHYILTMREAKTGKALATKTIDVPVKDCPTIVLGDDHIDYVEISEAELLQFAAPLLPKSVAARLGSADE
jgi:hypothetical protein